MEVEWDARKAARFATERGIDFNDAATVFQDPLAATVEDPGHSTQEARHATIGITRSGQLLVVVHVERAGRIRLITAWPATPAERHAYEERPRR